MRSIRRWLRRCGGVAALVGVTWLLALALPASGAARESRSVAGGRFELTVGFLTEPAFEGEPNGLYLSVRSLPRAAEVIVPGANRATPAASPTPNLGAELTAEVVRGSQVLSLPLEATGQPGVYRAVFVPTQPGGYVFRIGGEIGNAEIAEEFRTGARGIPPVVAVAGSQFPIEVPVNQGLLDALAERETEAERARTLGVVGIALGVLGLLAGGIAVVLSRRPPPGGIADPEPSHAPPQDPS